MWPKNVDAKTRLEQTVAALVETGKLAAIIRVPNAIAPMAIEADLRSRQLTASVEVSAPGEGRANTRLAWLLRQLKEAPPSLRIDVRYLVTRESTSCLLKDALMKSDKLLFEKDPKREPRSFKVALSGEIGTKRGKGPGSFVLESRTQTIQFYRSVLQQLRPWAAAAPKLPEPPRDGDLVTSPEPPDHSATEARDVGEGIDAADDPRTATAPA